MLSKRENSLCRLKEIANEISLSTEQTLENNLEWFTELEELRKELFRQKPTGPVPRQLVVEAGARWRPNGSDPGYGTGSPDGS